MSDSLTAISQTTNDDLITEQYRWELTPEGRPISFDVPVHNEHGTHDFYLAGPMSGYAQWNFPAFFDAEDRFRKFGLEIFNPARVEASESDSWTSSDGNKEASFERERQIVRRTSFERKRQIVRRDLDAVMLAKTGVIVLPGWRRSKGASAEVALANWLRLEILQFYSIEPEVLYDVRTGESGAGTSLWSDARQRMIDVGVTAPHNAWLARS